jgi:hypothetical protein
VPETLSEETGVQPPTLPQTDILVNGAAVRVTVGDLMAIQVELAARLAESRPLLVRRIAPELVRALPPAEGRVWISPDRKGRIGRWELTLHRGRPALAARRSPASGAALDRYVAGLEFAEGRWRVTDVRVETFTAR